MTRGLTLGVKGLISGREVFIGGDLALINRIIQLIVFSGLVRAPQPNTYDTCFYGVTTFTCTLYHCALR